MPISQYATYKDSGIQWLGKIPEHWEVKRNKNIFNEAAEFSESGEETLLTVSHITGVTPRSEKNVNMFFAETMEGYKIARPGDLIINTMWAWMGALGTSKYYGICSPAYNIYRSIKNIDYNLQYFDYLFRTSNFVIEMTRYSKGIVSSRLRLYPKDFYQLQTVLPALTEQTVIAQYLDHKTTAIDKKITLLEQKISTYQDLRKSIINETVCRGLDKSVPLKDSGADWIGQIPTHWEVKRLRESIRENITDGPHETPVFTDSGYPFISVDGLVNGELVFENCRYISSEDYIKFTQKVKIEKNDIFIGKSASIGKIARVKVDFEFTIWSPIAVIKFTKDVNPIFAEYFLKSDATQHQIENLATNNTQKNIAMKDIPRILLSIPPQNEQTAIANYLDKKIQMINAIIKNLNEQIEILKEYRKTLINDVVTGKIRVTSQAEIPQTLVD